MRREPICRSTSRVNPSSVRPLDLAERFPGLRILPVHADFTEPLLLPETGDPRARRVVYFPGSTIGNFSPARRPTCSARSPGWSATAAGCLIGFDLDKDESIVWPAYNDRRGVSAAFNLNVLERINRELGADFDVTAFSHRADYVRSKERMEMYLVSREAAGRPDRRAWSLRSTRARRSIPSIHINTRSSISAG